MTARVGSQLGWTTIALAQLGWERVIAATNWRGSNRRGDVEAWVTPLFHAEFGGDTIEGIRRRFKTTEAGGWLTQVGKETGGRRRSAVELFYRATGPAIFGTERWAQLPPSIKPVPREP